MNISFASAVLFLVAMGMTKEELKILSKQDVNARIKRIAFEIYENNFQEESVILMGSDERGGFIARQIMDYLKEISPLSVVLWHAQFKEKNRQGRAGRMHVSFSDL